MRTLLRPILVFTVTALVVPMVAFAMADSPVS